MFYKSYYCPYVSQYARKPVFGVSDQLRHNRSVQSQKKDFQFMNRNCTIHVAKTKVLISCAVTAQLICVFVFAKAKNLVFS